jgi:hypothetical protein
MLEKFSFKNLARENKKERKSHLDVSQLLQDDGKKTFGLSEDVVEYMISMGNLKINRLYC